MSKVTYISAEGLKKLKADLDRMLNVERPAISKLIGEAIEKGDISENAEYDAAKDAQVKLRIPLTEISLAGHATYKVTELFPGGESKTVSGKDLAALARTVKRDKTAGGGLLVLKIEPA